MFTPEQLNEKLLKKLRKSSYKKDKEFLNIFNLLDNENIFDIKAKDYSIPIKAEYVQKDDDIDRLTLYSFQDSFELLHTDVGNLQFLCKSAADPKYCLLLVDLFTSKTIL